MMILHFLVFLVMSHAYQSDAATEDSSDQCKSTSISKDHQCFIKEDDSLINSFGAVRITLNCSKECKVFCGRTVEDVKNADSTMNQLVTGLYSLFLSTSTSSDRTLKVFSPFEHTVVKVRSSRTKISMKVEKLVLHVPCVAFLISGLVLFFSAAKLSRSITFYYTGGVGIGIVASALIIVFIVGRLVPKKPAAYTIMLGGWSLSAFIMRRLWDSWQVLLMQYKLYVLTYIGIAGFLSFAVCYWKGPVQDVRSQKVIQWTIQLFGLALLYHSSQATSVSLAMVCAAALANIPNSSSKVGFASVKDFFGRFRRWKPEPRRFLTEEEYRREAEVETRRALEELKEFCNSPKCSPWKTMSRIKSPLRFARFVEGESHVSDAEITLHDEEVSEAESEENADLISDDETEDSEPQEMNGRVNINRKLVDPNISEDEDTSS